MGKEKSALGKWAARRAANLRMSSAGIGVGDEERLIASNIEDGAYHLASVIKDWLRENPQSTRKEFLRFVEGYCGERCR